MGAVLDWVRHKFGVWYGNVRVMCPHCGGEYTYDIKMQDGGQVVVCYSCHRNFRLRIQMGQVVQVEKP